jgi:hypothetical protein
MEANVPLARVEIADATHKDVILKTSPDKNKNKVSAKGNKKEGKTKTKSGTNKPPSRQERGASPRLDGPQDDILPYEISFQPVLQEKRPKSAGYMTTTLSRAGPSPLPLASPVKDIQRFGRRGNSRATNVAK